MNKRAQLGLLVNPAILATIGISIILLFLIGGIFTATFIGTILVLVGAMIAVKGAHRVGIIFVVLGIIAFINPGDLLGILNSERILVHPSFNSDFTEMSFKVQKSNVLIGEGTNCLSVKGEAVAAVPAIEITQTSVAEKRRERHVKSRKACFALGAFGYRSDGNVCYWKMSSFNDWFVDESTAFTFSSSSGGVTGKATYDLPLQTVCGENDIIPVNTLTDVSFFVKLNKFSVNKISSEPVINDVSELPENSATSTGSEEDLNFFQRIWEAIKSFFRFD